MCSVGVGLSKHDYGKMPPKRDMFWFVEYFYKVHHMTTSTKFDEG